MAEDHGSSAAPIPGQLVARLEAASAGSRELDCDIGIALGEWSPPEGATRLRPDMWRRGDINHYQPHAEVTTSLDAALALAERRGLSPTGVLKAAMYWAYQSDAPDTADALARFTCIAVLRDAALTASVEAEATTASSVGTSAASAPNPPQSAGE